MTADLRMRSRQDCVLHRGVDLYQYYFHKPGAGSFAASQIMDDAAAWPQLIGGSTSEYQKLADAKKSPRNAHKNFSTPFPGIDR